MKRVIVKTEVTDVDNKWLPATIYCPNRKLFSHPTDTWLQKEEMLFKCEHCGCLMNTSNSKTKIEIIDTETGE